jgi:hypothetical protein
MSGARPSVFNDDPNSDIDLSGFAPKGGPERPPVPPETVRRVSEEAGFHSRPSKLSAPSQRPTTPGRTGRTVLLNARITQRAHDRFHAIIESERRRYETGELTHRVTLGEVVERALAALEREMGSAVRSEG